MNINSDWLGNSGRRALFAALLAGVALGAGGVAWSSGDITGGPISVPVAANQPGFAELVARVRPAVVEITVTEQAPRMARQEIPEDAMPDLPFNGDDSPFGDMFQQFFGRRGQMQDQADRGPGHALGSGFVIDPAGYIVTNNHVIRNSTRIKVTLSDGGEYPATIVGHDPKTDLALLKINAGRRLPYVAWGDSNNARTGDWVIAMGNPYGLGGTVTAGIVSAHDRDIHSSAYDDYLQIDAPINPGNSGGPVFDQAGHVVGIDTAIYSPSGGSVGIGFAIPSNLAKNLVAQLRAHGSIERGWLGVSMQQMTPDMAKAVGIGADQGVMVASVQPNSPAARAAVRQGDVITGFNGVAVKAPRDLAVAVANLPSGRTATMAVWRDGSMHDLSVTMGTQPAENVAATDQDTPQED